MMRPLADLALKTNPEDQLPYVLLEYYAGGAAVRAAAAAGGAAAVLLLLLLLLLVVLLLLLLLPCDLHLQGLLHQSGLLLLLPL
jgi:hypothetical protein